MHLIIVELSMRGMFVVYQCINQANFYFLVHLTFNRDKFWWQGEGLFTQKFSF